MRALCTIIALFFTIALNAQADSNKTISSYDLCYGYRVFSCGFYGQLNTFANYELNRPVRLAGIAFQSRFAVGRWGSFHGCFSYNQVIPESIIVQDSIRGKLSGFVFGASFGWGLLSKRKKLGLFFFLGANTGRLRSYQNELIRQKNPFFAPKAALKPKVALGRLSLSLLLEAEYDISRPRWRRTVFAKDKVSLDPFRQTCITVQVGAGWLLRYKTARKR